MKKWCALASLIGGLVVIQTSDVWAHATFQSPIPRFFKNVNRNSYADDTKVPNQPCGDQRNLPATGVRTTYQKGSTISVQINETVEHQGHFSIYFSATGNQVAGNGSLMDVLVPSIPDANNDMGLRTVSVTLPNIECDTCVIQLIQWMDNTTPYFSCADIKLIAAVPSPTPTPSPLPSDVGGDNNTDSSDHSHGSTSPAAGGCGVIQLTDTGGIILGLLLSGTFIVAIILRSRVGFAKARKRRR